MTNAMPMLTSVEPTLLRYGIALRKNPRGSSRVHEIVTKNLIMFISNACWLDIDIIVVMKDSVTLPNLEKTGMDVVFPVLAVIAKPHGRGNPVDIEELDDSSWLA
jgi:hypothetical protein